MIGPGPALAIAGACALSFGGAYAAGRLAREKPPPAVTPRPVAVAQAPKPATQLVTLGTAASLPALRTTPKPKVTHKAPLVTPLRRVTPRRVTPAPAPAPTQQVSLRTPAPAPTPTPAPAPAPRPVTHTTTPTASAPKPNTQAAGNSAPVTFFDDGG